MLLLGTLLATAAWGEAQVQRVETEGLHLDRLAALGAGGVVAHWAGFRYFDRAWYQGEKRGSIRWLRDWSGNTYLHMDKGGHFMGGMFMSRSLGDAFRWTGFTPRAAAGLGAATSWALLFEVEMRDAYFADWGFSIPDFLANTAGASVPLMHTLWPRTQALNFKFSWFPSPLYLDYDERLAAGRPRTRYAIDDYEGMTFWLALTVEQALPKRLQTRWPDWLGFAVGYSARGMHGANVKSRGREREYPELPSAHPEILLSLDYDARYMPAGGWLWEEFKQQLNWLHFPAPAVRVYPDLRFYLLYL
ncbi:MAG: DUF2279 domain-containing protein [Candidatus Latescibacteria bacterium]|jgi:hypothetical protein|nr:DUF2279 domain-containing protein [Candidatus Latescibacterota bacterium]